VHGIRVAQVTTNFCADCVNYRGQSALELAAGADNVPMVEILLHLGSSRRAVDCAITRAALVGSTTVVALLLDAKPVDQGETLRPRWSTRYGHYSLENLEKSIN